MARYLLPHPTPPRTLPRHLLTACCHTPPRSAPPRPGLPGEMGLGSVRASGVAGGAVRGGVAGAARRCRARTEGQSV